MNEDFIQKDEKKRKYNIKAKEVKAKRIEEENEKMLRKMLQVKSFLSTKKMDSTYKAEHKYMTKKLRKINNGQLLLPNITQRTLTITRSITDSSYFDKKTN